MNNFCYIPQLSIQETAVQLDRFNFFSSAREIARNNFCPMEGPRHFLNHFRNISFATTVHWKITKLSLNNNRLAYVDIQVACSHPVLESLAIADNSMEYLSPEFMLCLSKVRHLDMSGNMFNLMNKRNTSNFKTLLRNLTSLKNIIIARNGLTSLPDTFFADNSALHTIDLSRNALEQSHFKMSHLQQLTLLNISNNVISRLDDTSRDILTSAIHLGNAEVDLRGNPLACMKCEDMDPCSGL